MTTDSTLDGPRAGLSRRAFIAAPGVGTAGVVGVSGYEPVGAAAAPSEGPVSRVTLRVNGHRHTLEVDHRTSLLDLLRDHLDMTGSKNGCDAEACGACTVLAGGRRINACLTLAVRLDGAEVTTIEGSPPAMSCTRRRAHHQRAAGPRVRRLGHGRRHRQGTPRAHGHRPPATDASSTQHGRLPGPGHQRRRTRPVGDLSRWPRRLPRPDRRHGARRVRDLPITIDRLL